MSLRIYYSDRKEPERHLLAERAVKGPSELLNVAAANPNRGN